MKKILSALLSSALMIVLFTIAITLVTGWDANYVGATLAATSVVFELLPLPSGIAFLAVTKNQLVERKLLEQFDNLKDDFMDQIPTKNEAVKNDTIRFTDIGADPNVLIDNAVYPIPSAGRVDDEIVVSLRKLETENTTITDDEIHALYYDKKSSVLDRHKIALMKKFRDLALVSLAPAADTANTPVLATTGDVYNNRKRLTIADILNFRERLVGLDIDLDNMVLALCQEHVTDLLLTDQVFKEQFHKVESGEIKKLYGFKMTPNNFNNMYDAGALTKLALDAVPGANHRNASTLVNAADAVRARGTAKMYLSKAEDNPEMRETKVGFRLYGICTPIRNIGNGAIVSALSA